MSKIYGFTGGIATGKSTILDLFLKKGYQVYDADKIAREVVVPGSIGLRQIVDVFGEDILKKDGTLNRKKLGSIVFGDYQKLKSLNKITRPLIKKRILKIISETKNSKSATISIFEIPLLFEGGYQAYFDGVISINIKPQVQLKRLMERNGLSKKVALERINSQMSMDERNQRADFIIDNSSDLDHLQVDFDKLISQL
ncbi:dephospho-CoA kinase [Companilactobacillus halodurans]|uniref:Dephospho-CoA kinase n=1 Tax=Companilactobacillus halodurans TaxID=2584183 RepID=A0A5P0ZVZ8_9LACO|nr:dephospho-CoA kinase [Companilactobacillus halodurans]MQS76476.1 dephospho-CoA kinase [Companilactobacillus halodurans]MQS97075.1 dephospho-CoA kinase [Companilactobacillus halodurans]